MRILLYSGKGGVGKTSIAAATGVQLAKLGRRTLIMSVDPAHSLGDSFDIGSALFHGSTVEPVAVADHLFLQEVNINHEIKHYWREISGYLTSVLRATGLSGVEAQELAVFPGMEELSAMLYVNQYRKTNEFDVVVLDCAPTAESLRFVSMPTTLDWYMKHIFGFHRSVLKAVRPLANRLAPVELPPDSYFRTVQDLFGRIQGIDEVLEDPQISSVRLVTNAEKMVLRETQRAFVYFSLHGLTVDAVIVNRLFPETVSDPFIQGWRNAQLETVKEMGAYFAPVPLRHVPLFGEEVVGYNRLARLAEVLYAPDEDPAAITRTAKAFTFRENDGHFEVILDVPFAEKGEIGLFKKADELVIELGTLRRHVGLPTTMAHLVPRKARLETRKLVVELEEPS